MMPLKIMTLGRGVGVPTGQAGRYDGSSNDSNFYIGQDYNNAPQYSAAIRRGPRTVRSARGGRRGRARTPPRAVRSRSGSRPTGPSGFSRGLGEEAAHERAKRGAAALRARDRSLAVLADRLGDFDFTPALVAVVLVHWHDDSSLSSRRPVEDPAPRWGIRGYCSATRAARRAAPRDRGISDGSPWTRVLGLSYTRPG